MKQTITSYLIKAIALCSVIALLFSCNAVKKSSSINKSSTDSSSVTISNLEKVDTKIDDVKKGIDSSYTVQEITDNNSQFDIYFNDNANTSDSVEIRYVDGVLNITSKKPIKKVKGNIKDFKQTKSKKNAVDTTKQITTTTVALVDKSTKKTTVEKQTKAKQSDKEKTIPQLLFIFIAVVAIYLIYKATK